MSLEQLDIARWSAERLVRAIDDRAVPDWIHQAAAAELHNRKGGGLHDGEPEVLGANATRPRSVNGTPAGVVVRGSNITIPFALLLSDNKRGNVRVGKAKWREWKKRKAAIRAELSMAWLRAPTEAANVIVRICWPDNRRRDPWNLLKLLGDCMKGIVLIDDCWQKLGCSIIEPGRIDRINPRVEVEVT